MEFFRLMKRRDVVSQNKANEVAYTRRGTDYVEALGSGFKGGKRKITTVWVTAKNGQKWEIPVDPKTGRVPDEYLYARFLDEFRGSRNGKQRNTSSTSGRTRRPSTTSPREDSPPSSSSRPAGGRA